MCFLSLAGKAAFIEIGYIIEIYSYNFLFLSFFFELINSN